MTHLASRLWRCACFLAAVLPLGCSSKPVLNVFNWGNYLDPEVVRQFESSHGCRVQCDTFSSDSELETRLLTGGGYDVAFPSDRSLTPLMRQGLLQELRQDLLPNLVHLDPQFVPPAADPQSRYAVPYFWGTVAVGVHTEHVPGSAAGFEVLFDERYRGRITLLNDAEHVVAVALMHLGLPANSTDDAHLAQVKALLVRQKPLVQAYVSDGYREKLVKGDAWVALGWSSDLLQAAREEPRVRVIVPATGTIIWTDSMVIPRDGKKVELAHAFINYLLDPRVAAQNANFVRCPSPNRSARAHIAPDLLNNRAMYLPESLLERCQRLIDRGPAIGKVQRLWREVRN